jgi:hypothetical protein
MVCHATLVALVKSKSAFTAQIAWAKSIHFRETSVQSAAAGSRTKK